MFLTLKRILKGNIANTNYDTTTFGAAAGDSSSCKNLGSLQEDQHNLTQSGLLGESLSREAASAGPGTVSESSKAYWMFDS